MQGVLVQGRMGDLTWPVVRDLVDDVIVISEEEIVSAMRLCYERMKVCESSWGSACYCAHASCHHQISAGM